MGLAAWLTGALGVVGSLVLAMCAMDATYLVLAAGEFVEGPACNSVHEWLLGFYRASAMSNVVASIIVALTVLTFDR